MVLENCISYMQPEMTSTEQVTEKVVLGGICPFNIKDILYMPLPPGLKKDAPANGFMSLTNTTQKDKILSVEFYFNIPIQGKSTPLSYPPWTTDWEIQGTVQVSMNEKLIGESDKFTIKCAAPITTACYSSVNNIEVKTGVQFITIDPALAVSINIVVNITEWNTLAQFINLYCPASNGVFSSIIKFFNYVDA